VVSELYAKYPRNFVFELTKASTYGKMKRWDDAVRTYEDVLMKVENKRDGYDRLSAARLYYVLGTSNVERLQIQPALDAFGKVVNAKDAPVDEKANAYLWMGKIYDSANDRTQALRQYDSILALDCNPEIKEQAQRYKRTPFK
jgi:tetratricopeptide (TPR) repeat protein